MTHTKNHPEDRTRKGDHASAASAQKKVDENSIDLSIEGTEKLIAKFAAVSRKRREPMFSGLENAFNGEDQPEREPKSEEAKDDTTSSDMALELEKSQI